MLNINKQKERLRESKVKHRNKYDRDDYTPSPLQADNISKMKWQQLHNKKYKNCKVLN